MAPVVLCEDIGFRGTCFEVTGDVPNLADHPLGDNALSSLIVPQGASVAVFEHPDYQGLCEDFMASEADLRNRRVGQDTASSVTLGVPCPSTGDSAPGSDGASESRAPSLDLSHPTTTISGPVFGRAVSRARVPVLW